MRYWIRFTIIALLAVFISGCLAPGDVDSDGEPQEQEASAVRPVKEFPLPDEIRGFEELTNLDEHGATGIWVTDGLAYLSGSVGLRIYDVADPADPILLADNVSDTQGTRDVDVFVHPDDNRTYAVLAHGSSLITLVDVTDPTAPVVVSAVEDIGAAHNIAVVPGHPVVYNSRSISTHTPEPGATGKIDIVDFADPEDPVVHVFDFPAVAMTVGGVPRAVASTTCHDVTFNEELDRAYCAGVTDTTIWDVSDPLDPEIIQVFDWPFTNIHHAAWDARDGDLLILGDEFAGVLAPAPMCHDTVEYPTSALWFIDISDLMTPVPLGYFQIEWDAAGASVDAGSPVYCSTHFGTVVEDEDLFVIGWYSAGTALVDFSDPMNPFQVAHHRAEGATSVWEARYWNGHVFTGDGARGMDVLKLVDTDGVGDTSSSGGRIPLEWIRGS